MPACGRRRRRARAGEAVCEPIEPSANRSPAAPRAPSSLGPADAAEAGRLAPVADDLGPGLGGGQREHRGEVVGAGDVRAGQLVQQADAQRGGVLAGWPAGSGAALGRGDRLAGHPAYDVVRVAGQVPDSDQPSWPRTSGTAASSAEDTTAECTSMRDR